MLFYVLRSACVCETTSATKVKGRTGSLKSKGKQMIGTLEKLVELASKLEGNGEKVSSDDVSNLPFNIGDKVIVRSRDAGVLFGEFIAADGSTIHLKNARQLWRWKASEGITLLDVAKHGVDGSECKFSDIHEKVSVFSACALIAVSDKSAETIIGVK
jgi:hypothetical protein